MWVPGEVHRQLRFGAVIRVCKDEGVSILCLREKVFHGECYKLQAAYHHHLHDAGTVHDEVAGDGTQSIMYS